LVLKITGRGTQRFLNIARKRKIYLQDITPSEDGLCLKIRPKDFLKIRSIVKKTRIKVKVDLKRGFPFFFIKMRERKIFLIGFFLAISSLLVASMFLWGVEVHPVGDKRVDVNEISRELKELGIKKGILKRKIDTQDLSQKIMTRSDKFSWVFSKIAGTRLIVSVAGRKESPQFVSTNEPCDIVAAKDGYIKNIVVKAGMANVKVGDTVRKGDVLVKGAVEFKDGSSKEVHALGEVFARTWVSARFPIEHKILEKERTGLEFLRYFVYLGNKKIFFKNRSKYFEEYDKIEKKIVENYFKKYLPIGIGVEKYLEKKTVERTLDIETATNYARDKAREEVRLKIPKDYMSASRNESLTVEEDRIFVEVIVECIENIGEKRKIEPRTSEKEEGIMEHEIKH
jgi:similar to stage IV sporulation protein